MKSPFKRTVCACSECLACCERQPGYLIPDDLPTISQYLGEPVEPYLVASPGALVGRVTSRGLEKFRVGSIVPRTVNAAGRCVFLDEGRCRIHAVAPFGCSMFDTHQRAGEWEERSMWGIQQMMTAEYQDKRSTLSPATTYNPSTAL